VDAHCAVSAGDLHLPGGNKSGGADHADGRKVEIAFGLCETLGRVLLQAQVGEFGSVAERFVEQRLHLVGHGLRQRFVIQRESRLSGQPHGLGKLRSSCDFNFADVSAPTCSAMSCRSLTVSSATCSTDSACSTAK